MWFQLDIGHWSLKIALSLLEWSRGLGANLRSCYASKYLVMAKALWAPSVFWYFLATKSTKKIVVLLKLIYSFYSLFWNLRSFAIKLDIAYWSLHIVTNEIPDKESSLLSCLFGYDTMSYYLISSLRFHCILRIASCIFFYCLEFEIWNFLFIGYWSLHIVLFTLSLQIFQSTLQQSVFMIICFLSYFSCKKYLFLLQ